MDTKTIDTYNKLAREYDDETLGFWDSFPRTFIDHFVAEVRGRVLDVGSGPGRDGLLLKNAGLDVVCLDASSSMVELSTGRGLVSVVGDFLYFKKEEVEEILKTGGFEVVYFETITPGSRRCLQFIAVRR